MTKAEQRAALEAQMAAFAAKGGKVQKIDANTSSGISNRDWYNRARDVSVSRIVSENDLIDQRHDLGHAVVNGLGEAIYLGE